MSSSNRLATDFNLRCPSRNFSHLTSLGIGWKNVHPDFRNSSKKSFHIFFLKISSFSAYLGNKFYFLWLNYKFSVYTILQALLVKWTRFEARATEVMRSNPTHHLSFIFQLENILRSILNFSTSYGRLTEVKSLLGFSFKWV